MNSIQKPYLSLVPQNSSTNTEEPVQLPLFPDSSNRIFFLIVTKSIHAGFANFIENLKPRWVLDFRPVPWFNFANYSRKTVFNIFKKNKVIYQDVFSNLKLSGRNDSRIASGRIMELVNDLLPTGYRGPIICLWDDPDLMNVASKIIPEKLRLLTKRDWQATITDSERISNSSTNSDDRVSAQNSNIV